jgi:DNA-binding transcriptional MerR regulator
MHRVTVKEAAGMIGISAKAIRLWEEKGLIPTVERTTAGYRVFTDADLSRLRFIRQAKSLGLTLSEIRELIDLQQAGTTICGRVSHLIDSHIAHLDHAMDDLLQLRQALTAARNAAGIVPPTNPDTTLCHIIETANLKCMNAEG